MYKENIETLYHKIIEICAKINRKLERIFELIRDEPLDRFTLAKEISYLRREIQALVELIEATDEFIKEINERTNFQIIKQLPRELAILFAILMAFADAGNSLKYQIENYISKIKYAGEKIIKKYSHGDYMYSDHEMKEEVYSIASDLIQQMASLDIRLERKLNELGYSKINYVPIELIVDLVTFKVRDWPRLNDKWACAACYLAALEVAVNKACKDFGIKADTFKEKLDKLVQYMKMRGIEIIKIERDIVSRLYDYRNDVLHGGYVPNDKEFYYIVEVVPKFIQSIKECKEIES